MMFVWAIVVVAAIFICILYFSIKTDVDANLQLLYQSTYFKGKVVWVTGAASGTGEGLCKALSRLGAKVILSARSKDKLMSVLRSLAHPEDSRVYVLDVSNRDSVSKAPHEVNSLFGRVDILINNAGIGMRSNFIDMKEDAARKLVEVDLLGTSFLTQGVINEIMLPQGNGHIVNISSICGKTMLNFFCAAKFGFMKLLKKDALDNADDICNSITLPIDNTIEECAELILTVLYNSLSEVWVTRRVFTCNILCTMYYFCYKLLFREVGTVR